VLTGIGFTMSLFIGELAFPDGDQSAAIRVGVLSGSLLSAIVGYIVLLLAAPREARVNHVYDPEASEQSAGQGVRAGEHR